MERISKTIGICFVALFFAFQIPELIGTFVVNMSKPEDEVKIQNRIDSNDVVVVFYPDGKLVISSTDGENYMSCFYEYSAVKAFHIGPFFDNQMGGRYRIIGTAIRPKAKDAYNVHISKFKGSVVNGQDFEMDDKMKGKNIRLIVNKDGSAKWAGAAWERADDSFATEVLFYSLAGHYADDFNSDKEI